MPHTLGILLAFVALLCWGFGDFLIQRTAKIVGSAKTLFFIGIVGFAGIFPFVRNEIFSLPSLSVGLLFLAGIVSLTASVFDFEALREGKISIIEPIIGLEVPLTVVLSITLIRERLTLSQLVIMLLVFLGITLAVTDRIRYRKTTLEKGAILGFVGALGIASSSFLIGVIKQGHLSAHDYLVCSFARSSCVRLIFVFEGGVA